MGFFSPLQKAFARTEKSYIFLIITLLLIHKVYLQNQIP